MSHPPTVPENMLSRLRILRLTWAILPEFLAAPLQAPSVVWEPALPDDLMVAYVLADPETRTVVLFCSSASFEPVPPGVIPPVWDLKIRRVDPEPSQ